MGSKYCRRPLPLCHENGQSSVWVSVLSRCCTSPDPTKITLCSQSFEEALSSACGENGQSSVWVPVRPNYCLSRSTHDKQDTLSRQLNRSLPPSLKEAPFPASGKWAELCLGPSASEVPLLQIRTRYTRYTKQAAEPQLAHSMAIQHAVDQVYTPLKRSASPVPQ